MVGVPSFSSIQDHDVMSYHSMPAMSRHNLIMRWIGLLLHGDGNDDTASQMEQEEILVLGDSWGLSLAGDWISACFEFQSAVAWTSPSAATAKATTWSSRNKEATTMAHGEESIIPPILAAERILPPWHEKPQAQLDQERWFLCAVL